MRELVEKLLWIVGTAEQGANANFKEKRRNLHSRFQRDKERYTNGWNGCNINSQLEKTLKDLDDYLELNQQPTRREQVQEAIEEIDQLAGKLGQGIREKKRDQTFEIWETLQDFAHHRVSLDINEFIEFLQTLERTVLDLLSPITALDQHEISSILKRFDSSDSDARRMLALIERGDENYEYFFRHVSDAAWLPILVKGGYFSHPPSAVPIDEGRKAYPIWVPIRYLASVAKQSPEAVTELLLKLPAVDNPWVYDGILEAAMQLHAGQSARLKCKMLEYAKLDFHILAHRFPSLIAHWTAENQTTTGLELASALVEFSPDPDAEAKGDRYRKDSGDWASYLKPSPRFESWDYSDILEVGIRPLAQKEPYNTACMLIDAVASVICLHMHPEQLEKGLNEDASEGWCRLLSGPVDEGGDEREALAHSMTFACEQVYEAEADKVAALDDRLRSQRWFIFKRLRQYLYALNPTEQTKPWIRDFILRHEDYGQSEYGYEFQFMVRRACQCFGHELLNKEELSSIFDTILAGPPKDSYKEWLGEKFTEEMFGNRQRRFHRMQLRMFEPVLFGEYLARFQQLEALADEDITDDDYSGVSKGEGGFISPRSPRSPEELAAMGNEEILAFINEWDAEHRDENDWLVEITIEALGDAFQTYFKDSVIPNSVRLQFWIENRREIGRPIYVRAIVDGMKDFIKGKNLERLNESLEFCEWVLSHPDQERDNDFGDGDQSRDKPQWGSSRRAVVDLIGTCIEKEANVPYTYQEQLINLLDTICTQFDWRLDRNKPVLTNGNDQLTEAINNTRSRALEFLVKLGFWMRNHDPNSDLGAVTRILERRFSPETEHGLTLPEYAILGAYYAWVLDLDRTWATAHRLSFFPQNSLPAWREAFGYFLTRTPPHKTAFEVLRNEYEFAIQHVLELSWRNDSDREFSDFLGRHLFSYYIWGLIPLRSETSLLVRFYQGTERDHKRWGNLFEYIGIRLEKDQERLESDVEERIHTFFEWRLAAGSSKELGGFCWWLEAECLKAQWRLDALSRVLDATKGSTSMAVSIIAKALETMLPEHTNKVVECFAKLTDVPKDSAFYVGSNTAKCIIQAGLGSSDEDTRRSAKRALQNLLPRGFDLQSLKD